MPSACRGLPRPRRRAIGVAEPLSIGAPARESAARLVARGLHVPPAGWPGRMCGAARRQRVRRWPPPTSRRPRRLRTSTRCRRSAPRSTTRGIPETWKGPNGSLFTNYTPIAGLVRQRHARDDPTSRGRARVRERRRRDQLVVGPRHADGRPIRDDPQRDDHEAHPLVAVLRARGTTRTRPRIRSSVTSRRSSRRTRADSRLFRLNGRFVVFVYAGPNDNCAMASRWVKAAQQLGIYVVLKVFNGYKQCASQPDGWHQYTPASSADAAAAVELLGVAGLLAVWRGRAPPTRPDRVPATR